jgi:hypothetical protein
MRWVHNLWISYTFMKITQVRDNSVPLWRNGGIHLISYQFATIPTSTSRRSRCSMEHGGFYQKPGGLELATRGLWSVV